ncbi:MAG: TIGR01906 family membrane protein [Lachnospiraceae bacterium]|nr:TIGR01906 family membrane protein [Lachnospiraceae bacterium]
MAYRSRNRRNGTGTDILTAILLILFIFSASVVLILNLRWLYYIDIEVLGLAKETGMDRAVIRANYDALIQYNQFWYKGGLILPTLAMSETGRIHFVEVKRIFAAVQYLCMGSGVLSLAGMIWKRRKRQFGYLRLAGILALVVPVVLGILAALNWENFFVAFHHLFFKNNYWIFDPAKDPVILILPDAFFLHCAIGILLCILIGSILCFWRYRRNKRRTAVRRRRK